MGVVQMSRRREEDHITENEQIQNESQRSEQDNLIKEWILTLNGKTTNQKGFGFTFIFSNLFLLPHEVFHPNQSFSVRPLYNHCNDHCEHYFGHHFSLLDVLCGR